MLYHLVAAILLSSDSDALDDRLYLWPAVAQAVSEQAIAEGLRLPTAGPVYSYELAFLRGARREMPSCPALREGDAVRRAAWLVRGQRELGDDFQRHCQRMALAESWQADRWESLRVESAAACLLWELLEDALEDGSWRWNACQPARRRLALRDLKKGLGDRDFALGLMPPPIPWMGLTRIEP